MNERADLEQLRRFLAIEKRYAALCTRHQCVVAGRCAGDHG